MAEKKFHGIDGPVSSPELSADYAAAPSFDRMKVGRLGVYFRDGFKLKYIPFDQIERAFIRIQEVNGKLCCGNTIFQYFRIVFLRGGKEFCTVMSENEKATDEALARIHEMAPHIAIGLEATA